MNKSLLLPFAVTASLGLAGLGLVLFAWQLPPFSPSNPTTENAYIRGKVTSLSPQTAGYVSEVLIQDFQPVKAGDVLIRLDDSMQKEKLRQAEAGLEAARANRDAALQNLRATELTTAAVETRLTTAELAVSNATTDSKRQHSLRDRGVLSVSAAEQTDLALSQANADLAQVKSSLAAQTETLGALRNQVDAAKASITQAEASLSLARIDLEHTEITAPADGTVGQVSARIGQYVNAATTLATHVGSERWVIANFTETSMSRLAQGQPVAISVDALGHQVLQGHIGSFSPATASEFSLMAGTNATGNFTKVVQRVPVRIEIDHDQPAASGIMPGMSVVVTAEARP